MGLKILSRLTQNRYDAGTLWVYDGLTCVYGPVRCRGEADNRGAQSHENPSENPTFSYGDHPSGMYQVSGMVAVTPPNDTYGPYFLLLTPTGGEALIAAQNGRTGIGIHGGRLHEDGRLRETYGCLRVDDETAWMLARLISNSPSPYVTDYECVLE